MIDNKLWEEFIKWGSGFTLEAERDYQSKGQPLIYHLSLYGLWWDHDNEFVGRDINNVIKQAIKVGKKYYAQWNAMSDKQFAHVDKKHKAKS